MKSELVKIVFSSNAGVESLIMRTPIGIIFFTLGAQKLFGWFEGHGLEETGQWITSITFEHGFFIAFLASIAEFIAGVAIVMGVLMRPIAAIAAFAMLMAMMIHLSNDFLVSSNDYGFALSLLATAVGLIFMGGGKYSLDYFIWEYFCEWEIKPPAGIGV